MSCRLRTIPTRTTATDREEVHRLKPGYAEVWREDEKSSKWTEEAWPVRQEQSQERTLTLHLLLE